MSLPFVLDMETSDPDDFLTLLLLLGHPGVALRAVTITPGTRARCSDLRFVSENVCHGVIYEAALHARVRDAQPTTEAQARALALIVRGMGAYLAKRPEGKAFHDPLAACCAIDPSIARRAEVELDRAHGGWGARLAPGSGVRIIVGYDHERFVQTLLGRGA